MAHQCNFIFLVCILILGLTYFALGAPSDNTCAGGYREGSQTDLGTFWYECRNGQLLPKGCLTPGGGRIELRQTYDDSSKSIRLECIVDSQGYPALVHKSCWHQNRERQQNERWDDGKVIYSCVKDGVYLSVESVGCIRDNGLALDLGQKVNVDDLVYECRQNRQGVPTFLAWGCATKDGHQYATGDSYDQGDLWYFCMNRDGVIKAEQIGCVHDNIRLKDGDRFFKDDVIFQCEVRQTRAEIKVAGCVTQNVVNGAKMERRVGCSWVEGNEPFTYTLTCQPNEAAKTATKTAVRCNYAVDRGTYNVELGCYKVFARDKTAVACMKGATVGDVKFIALPVDENGNVPSPPSGLRLC